MILFELSRMRDTFYLLQLLTQEFELVHDDFPTDTYVPFHQEKQKRDGMVEFVVVNSFYFEDAIVHCEMTEKVDENHAYRTVLTINRQLP